MRKVMDENLKDNDIVQMDFPEYREEHSALPDVENESSFTAHKEEIYRRNRLIAAEEQTRLLKEEEQKKAEKRERTEELYRDAESAEAYVISRKMAVPIVIVFCVALFAIVALLNKNSRVTMEYAAAEALTETTVTWQTVATEKVTRVTTERTRRETEEEITEEEISETTVESAVETETETTKEIPPEVLKTTIVREPFAEDGNSYVFNTDAMSYRFTAENNGINEYGIEKVTINVSAKNLTDYKYMITCTSSAFRITDSSSGNSQSCDIEHYDPQYTHFSSPFKYADDEEWHDGLPIAFEFNESNLCEFSLNVYFDQESDNNYNTFVYNSKAGFPQYNQYSDVSFEIPLDEILKYAN